MQRFFLSFLFILLSAPIAHATVNVCNRFSVEQDKICTLQANCPDADAGDSGAGDCETVTGATVSICNRWSSKAGLACTVSGNCPDLSSGDGGVGDCGVPLRTTTNFLFPMPGFRYPGPPGALNFVYQQHEFAQAVDTEMNNRAPKDSPTFTGLVEFPTPFNLGPVSVTATATELNFSVGTTGPIQQQLDAKASLNSPALITPTITSFSNAPHTHQDAAGGGTILDSAIIMTDITGNNATTSDHGFLPKLSGVATEFQDGTGGWSVPAGGDASLSFETQNAPAGTDPVADIATDTLNWVATAPVTITGDATTDTLTVAIAGASTTAPGAVELATSGETASGVAIQGDDTRLSNARAPTAHTTTHQHGGADEVATATAAANAIPKAGAGGTLADGWILATITRDAELDTFGEWKTFTGVTGTCDSTTFVRADGVCGVPAGSGGDTLNSVVIPSAGSWTLTGSVGLLESITDAGIHTYTTVKPVKSVLPAARAFGGCAYVEGPLNTGKPITGYFICTDADTDGLAFDWPMPDSWDAGTLTVEIAALSTNATPTGNLVMSCSGQSVRSGDVVANQATTGEQTVTLTFAVTSQEQHATTAAITLQGTSAAGAHIYLHCDVDATLTTATMGDVKIMATPKVEYTIGSRGD